MNEREAVTLKLRRELCQISFDCLGADMDERVKTKNEIDRAVRNHCEAVRLVQVKAHFRVRSEPAPARLHALRVWVDQVQMATMLAKEMTPAAEPGSDFQNRFGRERHMNARQNAPEPLR